MSYRLVAKTCKDGDCPSIWVDDSDGSVMVRGPEDGGTVERDIRYTADEWRSLMAQATAAGL